ncbi:hypothetical protein EDD17DRAFT_125109 [Pisolithus thermaeus]|nr:hypothetical protein EV401DRAFT_554188 [Pisolithus croceorrhizus]KAI6166155.1 hypothetical protein EDD17DRAFT_125109 [Pisolithus thermaeus]
MGGVSAVVLLHSTFYLETYVVQQVCDVQGQVHNVSACTPSYRGYRGTRCRHRRAKRCEHIQHSKMTGRAYLSAVVQNLCFLRAEVQSTSVTMLLTSMVIPSLVPMSLTSPRNWMSELHGKDEMQ